MTRPVPTPPPPTVTPAAPPTLHRALGVVTATALVAGTIIGTGIFLKPAVMAQGAGSEALVLVAWIVAALLSLAGALTYAELGALLPEAGGEYVYLRQAYGRLPAFLYGWMRFFIGSAGSIAAYAVGSATFLAAVVDVDGAFPSGRAGLAIVFIATFTATNCLALTFGARLNAALTALKILSVLALCAAIFTLGPATAPDALSPADTATPAEPGFLGLTAFSTAVLAALWAFDGWNNLVMVGGEIHHPQRNLPRALALGMGIVTALYLIANAAYFHALDFDAVARSYSTAHKDALPVATNALAAVTDAAGAVTAVSILFLVSALGAMNGSILTASRVPYALARDGLFPRPLAALSHRRVPVLAVVTQALVASVLALSGTFDQLTDAVVFASWIFYGLCTGAVFILRRRLLRETGTLPPFRTPLYPILPALFIAVTLVLLVNTVASMPALTALGLGIIALGVPVYLLASRRRSPSDHAPTDG